MPTTPDWYHNLVAQPTVIESPEIQARARITGATSADRRSMRRWR
jgi:hypothetical protein